MSRKMIFMLLSLVWGLTREIKRNFEPLVQETRPRTCCRMVFKFKKSKRSLKSMRFVKISLYHTWRPWRKIEKVSHNLSRTMFTNRSISEEESSVENDSVRFGVKVTVELGFDFKTFCIGNREHRLIHV